MDTPEAHFVDSIMSAVYKFQARIIGKKVAIARQHMIENGETTFRPPLGYKNVHGGVITDPKTSPHIQRMFSMYASGKYTTREIADAMNRLGLRTREGKPISPARIRSMITNRYYCGWLVRCCEMFKGKHPKLVSDGEFERCQEIIQSRQNPNKRIHKP